MLSLQAVTLFQVVTKLINRNWFPVRFILKLLSALLVNRRKDTHLMPVFHPACVVILSRQTLSGTTLNLQDLSYLVTTCFSVQSPCAILNLPIFIALALFAFSNR